MQTVHYHTIYFVKKGFPFFRFIFKVNVASQPATETPLAKTLIKYLGERVYLDWDLRDRDGVIHAAAKTQDQWEKGVIYTFECLYQDPPCETSKAVIDALKATSKTVVIVPFTLKSYETAVRNLPAKLNAGAKADNAPDATVRGKLSDELDDSVLRQIAVTPDGPEREKLIARSLGTAAGSNSHLYFTAQDWALPSSSAVGLDAADETLLHELVHSLRQAKGQEDPDRLIAPFPTLRSGERDGGGTQPFVTRLSQIYDTLEEFASIVITNIYRSENNRVGLRRHHLADKDGKDPALSPPLTSPRSFLTVWRSQLERLQRELPGLCDQIAPVDCYFNPLFELYAAQNRIDLGSRKALPKPFSMR